MQVKLVIADIEEVADKEQWMLTQIAPRYVEKYQKHKREMDKKQELLAGYLLKKYLGVEKSEQILIKDGGKPALVQGTPYFNLSHSGRYVVLAIADKEVGIDIERVRPCHEATVKKVFSQEQQKQLSNISGKDRDQVFTRMWTELEAKLKVGGCGFGKEWKSEKDRAFFVETRELDDYYISIAARESITIDMEWLQI